MELIGTRGAWGKWLRSQLGHPQSGLSIFGFNFLQFFRGGHQEGQVGTSYELLGFLLFRRHRFCFLALGVWGRYPGVSFLQGRGVGLE